MEHAVMCPQCNAPLAPHRFATSIVCSFCGTTVRLDESSVSASIFHDAFRTWNAPETYQVSSWITIGGRHWALEKMIAQGDISDVYTARLARWPTELVIVKLLRDPQDAGRLDNEWQALQTLHKSGAPGADTFTRLMPQPVVHGDIPAGLFAGRRASIFRWASGFLPHFRGCHPGVPPGNSPAGGDLGLAAHPGDALVHPRLGHGARCRLAGASAGSGERPRRAPGRIQPGRTAQPKTDRPIRSLNERALHRRHPGWRS